MIDDPVNHPKHYKQGNRETIDVIFDVIVTIGDPKLAMCIGNAVKYLCRFEHKGNPLQDLKKAQWYIDKAVQIEGLKYLSSLDTPNDDVFGERL